MKKKTSKKNLRRNLSRLVNKLDVDFEENETEFLNLVNLADVNYGDDFIRPYMQRYYVHYRTWKK